MGPDRDAAAASADALERGRHLVIPELLAASARRAPGAPAIAFEERLLSFGELERRSGRLAAALAARGVRPGQNVGILMYNRPEFVEAFLAIQRLGACAVPVNFRLSREEVSFVLENSRAVGILSDGELAAVGTEAAASSAAIGFHLTLGAPGPGLESFEEALAAAAAPPPEPPADEERLAFLMYTSGTTGRPKGAMLTHRNLVVNTMNWLYEVGARTGDVWLSGLPLFHIGGINGLLPFMLLGAPAVIEPSTGFDPARSIERLARHEVSMCFFVPTQWAEICARPEVAGLDPERLRVAMWGASPAPLSTLERLVETFPRVRIVNAFGQTEMSSNTAFLHGEDAVRKMGSIGRPAIGVQARIVDPEGNDVAQGEVGEIVYRGPTVMRGYFENEQASAEAFAGGWFHSGDLVREDPEGFLYVVDRLKDMLISGGENVYPAEVERALLEHEAVAEVAVFGVPHPRWVETPLAVVVLAPGAEAGEEELIEHCRERLAGYKKPGAVIFAAELPRNAAGKVLKRELRLRHGERFGAAS